MTRVELHSSTQHAQNALQSVEAFMTSAAAGIDWMTFRSITPKAISGCPAVLELVLVSADRSLLQEKSRITRSSSEQPGLEAETTQHHHLL